MITTTSATQVFCVVLQNAFSEIISPALCSDHSVFLFSTSCVMTVQWCFSFPPTQGSDLTTAFGFAHRLNCFEVIVWFCIVNVA